MTYDKVVFDEGGSGGEESDLAHGGDVVAGEIGHGRSKFIIVQEVE